MAARHLDPGKPSRPPPASPGIHDRGQVVTDVAVALAHGATNVAATTRMLADAQIVCGPGATPATVCRVFDDLDAAALARLATARAVASGAGCGPRRPPGRRVSLATGRRSGLGRVDRGRMPPADPVMKIVTTWGDLTESPAQYG